MKYIKRVGDIEITYEAETPEQVANLYNVLNDDKIINKQSNNISFKSFSTEELLAEVMVRPIPVNYDSKKKIKFYIEKLIKTYEEHFKNIS